MLWVVFARVYHHHQPECISRKTYFGKEETGDRRAGCGQFIRWLDQRVHEDKESDKEALEQKKR